MKNSLFILVILISLYLQPINAQERIVSLAPSQTELLFAIGADKEIVGVSDYSDFPNEAKNLPHIGGVELNIEKIVSLDEETKLEMGNNNKKYFDENLTATKISYLIEEELLKYLIIK